MATENVELLLLQAVDSINRGDIAGALENAADDFELDWSNAIGPGRSGIYRGRDQVRKFWISFAEAC